MSSTASSSTSSSPSAPGKDDPLPIKSREEAKAWARQFVEHMAQVSGAQINSEPETAEFYPCVGRNGEQAPDDRYFLMFDVRADVPNSQHSVVVRKVKELFTKEGLEITGYRETPDGSPDTLVGARHPASRYVAGAASAGKNRMSLSVDTPCLKPPPGSTL